MDEYLKVHYATSLEFQRTSQIKSLARLFTIDLFEGAGGTYMRGFRDWLETDDAFKNQDINAGTGGALFTTDMLDEMISKHLVIPGSTFFYCNPIHARRLKKLSKGKVTDEYNINYTPDQMGYFGGKYDGIPWIPLQDGKNADLLSVVENDGSGNLDTSSIYLVTWGTELAALASSNPEVAPNGVPVPSFMGFRNGDNYEYERFEWYVNLIPHVPKCITRLKHVTNALA